MPEWAADIRRRLAASALRPTREIEIVDEIAQHLDERYARLVAQGTPEADAEAAAWRELDEEDALGRAIASVERPAQLILPPPGTPARRRLASVGQDVRYSVRSLAVSPLFTATVLVALALSIGPVTAIVSIGNWLLWRPHPGVTDSRSLATVWFGQWSGNGVSPSGVSNPNLDDIRSRARTIAGIAGVQESNGSLAVPGTPPVPTRASLVTANFFDVLGVRLSAGRGFQPEEDTGAFGAPVVVISHGVAQSRFGSTAAALGRSILLNSQPFSVIGVAPPAFGGVTTMGGVDAWLTGATWPYLVHASDERYLSRTDGLFYEFVVRKAPSATFDEVDAELKVIARQLVDLHPAENRKFTEVAPRLFPGLGLQPLTRARTGQMVKTLLSIGAVLLVLGCANVANLLAFRAARREHEIAVRKALGASRFRLLQLQLIESWLLALGGSALGLLLAFYLKQLIEALLFPKPPGMELVVPIDLRVLALTVVVALATGTLAALAPGWLLSQTRGLAALGRTTMTSSRAPKLRGGLAVLQLALSLTLLVGALLLISTLRNLRAVDLGFDPDRITVVNVALGDHGYDAARALAYHREVFSALQAHGEFEAVSLSSLAPFGSNTTVRVVPPGGDPKQPLRVRANGVGESYFSMLSIPLLHGRAFTAAEASGSEPGGPVIVNETLARLVFGRLDVVGSTLRFTRTAATPEMDLVIVGVAKDSRWNSISGTIEPFLYRPFGRFGYRVTNGVYMIKSRLDPRATGEIANSIAARTAAGVPLSFARALTTGIDQEVSEERVFAWMLSLLAALGFALAALGLYGLMAQTTIERRREFGIRMALGASGSTIARLVLLSAVMIGALGTAIGLPLAYFGTRMIQSMLFGVSPLDPIVYASAAAILGSVVGLACAVPAWRAVRVPAAEVLRSQ